MNKLLQAFMLCTVFAVHSQDIKNTIYIYNDPVAQSKDGVNYGIGFDYQRQTSFNSINIFFFPHLRGKNYTELTASHGLNHHFGIFQRSRVFGKMKCGFIWRDHFKYPLIGFEAGYDQYIFNDVYIGFTLGYDLRTDGKVWDQDIPNYWSKYGQIKIGIDL